jgi:hypothetical protein
LYLLRSAKAKFYKIGSQIDNETSQSTEDSISYKINEASNDSLQYFDEGFALWCPKPLEKNYDMANKIGSLAVYECMSFDGIKYTISINDISIEYLNSTKTNDQIGDEYLDYYKGKLDEFCMKYPNDFDLGRFLRKKILN